jgi:hypothetical protein
VNSRLLCVDLVKHDLAEGILFGSLGQICQPKDALYRKSLLVVRGSFRPPTLLNLDMIKTGMQYLCKNISVEDYSSILTIAEISMNVLLERGGEVDNSDFLARVELLNDLGFRVLISNKREFYSLSQYLSGLTKKKIAFVAKTHNLEELFEADRYSTLEGGLLGALGGLFGKRKQLYIYPDVKEDLKTLKSFDDLKISDDQRYILNYLLENRFIQEIDQSIIDKDVIAIWSREVAQMIASGDEQWQELVPSHVKKKVLEHRLFDLKSN